MNYIHWSFLSLLSLPLKTILSRKVWNSHWWDDRFHGFFFASVTPFSDKDTLPQRGLKAIHINPDHNTILDKWTLTCLSHNKLIVWQFESHSLHIHSIWNTQNTHTHTPPILSVLRNLLACQHWKTWKRSSARVHHALNIRLAACAIGEQSRYYFKTIPVNSGTHYLIYNHVNDSVHAIYGSSVVPVSMDSVYDINRLKRLGGLTPNELYF